MYNLLGHCSNAQRVFKTNSLIEKDIFIMKNKFKVFLTAAAIASMTFSACNLYDVEKVPELNNATVESILTGASAVQISQLAVGVQRVLPSGYVDLSQFGGSIGREIVLFNSTDNRYYTELQGQVPIDPAGIFYAWYGGCNQTRRRAELFYLSAAGSPDLTPAQKKACEGFAKTVQAFTMLNLANMMGDAGIRISFEDLLTKGDLLKPGPFVTYAEALTYCKKLADDGATALDAGGAAFPFTIASGWGGFNTPANFKKFNRGVAARVAMYQKDWAGMQTALNGSFVNLAGDLATGPSVNYSTQTGDAQNLFFKPLNDVNNPQAIQNANIADVEAGDKRFTGASIRAGGTSKVSLRSAPVAKGGFAASTHELQMYATNVSNVSIIRNEELILMQAEAKLQANNLGDAVTALDTIRVRHGLKTLAVAKPAIITDKTKLIDELLNQRRYSLFMEGSHRWFDMRRYGKLAALPKDLPTHNVVSNYPKPQSEVDWDNRK
jgi:starch-binding outer membrane protein, SusD/RagB family